ncbi:MAG: glycosyltransferase [Bacteroidetes bacterium]|nr:glycosyltransferase [Bacteroidota bacterium]
MVIAVNRSLPPKGFYDDAGDFISPYITELALQFPHHQFLYIFETDIDNSVLTAPNISAVSFGRAVNSSLLLQYRLSYTLPAVLKKHKVDIFLATGGLCAFRTSIPQCLVVTAMDFMYRPKQYSGTWLKWYKTNTQKSLVKATAVITAANLFVKPLEQIAGENKFSYTVIRYGVQNIYTPADWQQKELVKEQSSGGAEYFLYSGPISTHFTLTALLKAFSFFKKRQKSNMQLIIASAHKAADRDLVNSLSSYKYRNDVKLLETVADTELARLTASCYALIIPAAAEGISTISLAQAMQSNVPLIVGGTTLNKEICGDAAAYFIPGDFNDMADKMMWLFKDENQRDNLINKAREQAALFDIKTEAAALWEIITGCRR